MRDLETKIGYSFHSRQLLAQALRHASSLPAESASMSYQRLEFLGDSVLNLCVAEEVYTLFPDAGEGELTRARSSLINNRNLHDLGTRIGLPEAMKIDRAVRSKGGGITPKMVADVVEAVAGAIFLDGGFAAARAFVREHLLANAAGIVDLAARFDAKTRLQERCQRDKLPLPEYRLAGESGPPHERTFRVVASACGTHAESAGSSKKEAEMNAAAAILARLEKEGKSS
jgi:ribonuclease-3